MATAVSLRRPSPLRLPCVYVSLSLSPRSLSEATQLRRGRDGGRETTDHRLTDAGRVRGAFTTEEESGGRGRGRGGGWGEEGLIIFTLFIFTSGEGEGRRSEG